MWLIRSVIILVGVIAFLWIGMNNADQRVDFTFFTKVFPQMTLNLLLLVVFAAGMVFSFLIFIFSEFQLRHTVSQKQREVYRLERELAALRNLPLEEGDSGGEESTMSL
ncbi:MAG: LapA family protein [Candidatus Krumholzibacteriia bacterium]